jgi:hypothetical protein
VIDGEQKNKKMKMVQKLNVPATPITLLSPMNYIYVPYHFQLVDHNQLERDRALLKERIRQHNKQMQKDWDIIINERIDIHKQKCKLKRGRAQLNKEMVQHNEKMKVDQGIIAKKEADINVQKHEITKLLTKATEQLNKQGAQLNEKMEVDRELEMDMAAQEKLLKGHRRIVEQSIAQYNRCLYLMRREQDHLNNTRLAFESRMDNFDLDFDILEHEIDEYL